MLIWRASARHQSLLKDVVCALVEGRQPRRPHASSSCSTSRNCDFLSGSRGLYLQTARKAPMSILMYVLLVALAI